MEIELTLEKFMQTNVNVVLDGKVTFKHDVIQLPDGHYGLDDTIHYLDKRLQVFGASLTCVTGSKCCFGMSKIMNYY